MSSSESPELTSSDEENSSQPASDELNGFSLRRPLPPSPPIRLVFEKEIKYEGTKLFVSIYEYDGTFKGMNQPYYIEIYQDDTKKVLISAMDYKVPVSQNNSNGDIGELKKSDYNILHTSERQNEISDSTPVRYNVYSRLNDDKDTSGGYIEFSLRNDLLHEKYLFKPFMVYPLCKDNEHEPHFFYYNLLVEVYIIDDIHEDIVILNYIVSLIMAIKEKYNGDKDRFERTLKLLQKNVYNEYFIAINVAVENIMKMINKRRLFTYKSLFDLINAKEIRKSIKPILGEDDLKHTDEFICLLKDLINYDIVGDALIRLDFNSLNINENYEKIEKHFYDLMIEYIDKQSSDPYLSNELKIDFRGKHGELTNTINQDLSLLNVYPRSAASNVPLYTR